MRRIKVASLLVLLLVFSTSCKKEPSIEGLWLVKQVQVGKMAMTPVQRWTRFNADGTHTSGNGWLQHAYGNWKLDGKSLTVIDKNGIHSNINPFQVDIQENYMDWRRMENGEEVIVNFKRIEKIPQSDGNKLVGLWKLNKSTDDGNDITAMVNPDGKSMLQLGWDNRYVQHNMPKGKNYGVYKIHGHKNEIQLVNYGSESKFSFWNFTIENDQLILESTDKKSTMTFERINNYLN